MYKDTIDAAYKIEIIKVFSVLVDNMVQSDPEALIKFRTAVSVITQAYELAKKNNDA